MSIVETHYRESYSKLVKIARGRVGDYSLPLAEEAVQEAFTRALKYLPAYNPRVPFDKWFMSILYNAINNIKRQEMDAGMVYEEEEEVNYHNANDILFTKEISDALSRCSIRDQEILNAYFFYGFKSREVAEITGTNHSVVRDVVRTFRKKVRD